MKNREGVARRRSTKAATCVSAGGLRSNETRIATFLKTSASIAKAALRALYEVGEVDDNLKPRQLQLFEPDIKLEQRSFAGRPQGISFEEVKEDSRTSLIVQGGLHEGVVHVQDMGQHGRTESQYCWHRTAMDEST